jgi:short-subunit dehydrogenase
MNHISENQNKHSKGLVVITGCDSGIGKSLVPLLIAEGYSVFLSYLDQNPFEDQLNIFSRKMDIRNSAELESFCRDIKVICSSGEKLAAVISNVGVALGGPIENLPMSIYRDSFEINYFGMVELIQALIPELIQNKGKIILNGSMAGRIAPPFMSPYASTKFAIEGFSDSLRREMNPFGVKTILLEPASVATPIWNKAKEQDISFVDHKYLKSLYCFRDKFIEGGNQGLNVELAAQRIIEILEKKKPKPRYIIAKSSLGSKLLLLIPTTILDKIFIKMYQMLYGRV